MEAGWGDVIDDKQRHEAALISEQPLRNKNYFKGARSPELYDDDDDDDTEGEEKEGEGASLSGLCKRAEGKVRGRESV